MKYKIIVLLMLLCMIVGCEDKKIEDKEHVVESIKNLIEKGEYQENLWQK